MYHIKCQTANKAHKIFSQHLLTVIYLYNTRTHNYWTMISTNDITFAPIKAKKSFWHTALSKTVVTTALSISTNVIKMNSHHLPTVLLNLHPISHKHRTQINECSHSECQYWLDKQADGGNIFLLMYIVYCSTSLIQWLHSFFSITDENFSCSVATSFANEFSCHIQHGGLKNMLHQWTQRTKKIPKPVHCSGWTITALTGLAGLPSHTASTKFFSTGTSAWPSDTSFLRNVFQASYNK